MNYFEDLNRSWKLRDRFDLVHPDPLQGVSERESVEGSLIEKDDAVQVHPDYLANSDDFEVRDFV